MKEPRRDWETRKLAEFSKIIMGQSPPGKSYTKETKGVPLLNGAADFEGKFPKPIQNTTRPTKLSKKGDILLCIRATIGNVTFSDKEYCLGRGVSAIRITDKRILPEYISLMLEGKIELLISRSLGSTIKGIKKEDLENLEFSVPPMPAQKRIVAVLEKAYSIRKNREQSNQMTARFHQAVFSKMFGDPSRNPKLWQVATLESACSKIVDCPHSTPTYLETGIPLIRTPNIKKGYIDFKKTKFISYEEHMARSRRICPLKGDML
jgi:type I restriction enzyme S subunit